MYCSSSHDIQRLQVQAHFKGNHWEDLGRKGYSGSLHRKHFLTMSMLPFINSKINSRREVIALLIQVVKIAQQGKKKNLPKILIDAGIHARYVFQITIIR